MNNLTIFITHSITISLATLLFARLGLQALTAFISLLFVIANLFVIKQIELCGLSATCADAFIIGISFGINIIQEYYGKKTAQKTILISIACALVYTLATQFHLWYLPSCQDITHPHFAHILQFSWRLLIASLVSYSITQLVDTLLYKYMLTKTQGRYFVLRNYLSIAVSQALDTIIFTYIGLYGLMEHLEELMIVSYAIKIGTLLLATPWMILTSKIVQKRTL